MKINIPDLIYLEWADSNSDRFDWTGQKDALEWAKDKDGWIIKSVGFKLEETKEYILLCAHFNPQQENSKVCGLMKIPKSAITKRFKIKYNGKTN